MRKWLVIFIILVGSASVNVYAKGKGKGGCNTNSFKGFWKVYVTTVDSESYSWRICDLVIDNAGVVDPSSVCVTNEGEELAVDDGIVNVDKSCTFDGEIVLGEETLDIVEGQLTGNKKASSGVGLITGTSDDSDLGLFTFNGIQGKGIKIKDDDDDDDDDDD